MRELISIIIPALFLFIYGILSSIEFGISIFQRFPNILKDNTSIKTYVQPIWEVTNVFLVFTIVSLFTFFPSSSFFFGTHLLLPLFIGMLFLGLRSLCMIYIIYGNYQKKIINTLFLCCSFLAPISLANSYIYIVTGESTQFFITPLAIAISLYIICSILLISSSFFQYYNKTERDNKKLEKFVFNASIGFYFSFLILIRLLHVNARYLFLHNTNNYIFLFAVLVLFLLLLFNQFMRRTHYNFVLICILQAVVFFSLFLLHLPYLIFPNVTIYNSFTDYSVFPILITSFIIGMVFVIPGLIMIYCLFIRKK